MIKVKKLKQFETIAQVILGAGYFTEKKDNLITLNKSVKVKMPGFTKNLQENEFPVRIKKIIPPNTVEGELIEGDYEIEDDSPGINTFSLSDIGKKEVVHCTVSEIFQTSGPTLFTLFDGIGTITSKSFAGPGVRAFPEIEEGDAIKATILLKEREGILEAELLSFTRLTDKHEQQFIRNIEKKMSEHSMPAEVPFLIKSDVLEKLKPAIINVASEIRKAIIESRQIIIRHHADCDGYTGAIALERAILPLVFEHHKDEMAQWRYYKRSPSKTPFYDYSDATKDIAHAIEDMMKYGRKEPLVVLVDNGSTNEDILGIRKIKIYNAKVVVVDHHYPGIVKDGKVEVDDYVDAHVNPYLVGGDSNLTAGMLATEVARFVNDKVENISFLPALAGVGDRVNGDEFEQYMKLIEAEKNLSVESLKQLSEVIDFEAHYLRFIESRGMVEDLLGNDWEKQRKLVSLLYKDIEQRRKQQLETCLHYVEVDDSGKYAVACINADKVTNRGEYPAVGKSVGIMHDELKKKYSQGVISLGIGSDFITIRVSNEVANFNVNLIVKELKEKLPHIFAEGGGHESAGTIKFVSIAKDEVVEFVMKKIEKL